MLFGLAPRRVYLAARVGPEAGGALTPPFHPSPVAIYGSSAGILSVALAITACAVPSR